MRRKYLKKISISNQKNLRDYGKEISWSFSGPFGLGFCLGSSLLDMWFFKPWDLLDLRFFGCETFGSLIGFVSKVFLGLSFFGLVLECD